MRDNENIQVVVRCRGRNSKETSIKSTVVVDVDDEEGNEVVLNPSNNTGISAQLNSKTYSFDKVFGPMSDQQVIFNKVAAPLFNEFLKGYNCSMLVYGMTSTGKTYTMSGDDKLVNGRLSENAGIIPRVLFKLFDVLNDSNEHLNDDYVVKCSFVEIYNEELKDLLTDEANKKLRIFDQKAVSTSGAQSPAFSSQSQNNKSAIHIQNLEEVVLRNAHHGITALQKGLKIRQVAATKMNDVSSRSHTIFTLNLYKKNGDSNDLFRISKMNLVDLAGSENISRSGALNQRAKEAGSINQSLLTLGRVINSLVEKNQQHIPYRESKLTRLLQDSLGGSTKTCLIATISPAKINYDETSSTLEYANKAKSIENKPQLGSLLSKDILVKDLGIELSKLQSDLSATRLKNGYFMNNDSYEELMSDNQEYKTEINESKRNIDLLKKQNDTLKKKIGAMEAQNVDHMTLINTLNATVESLHNKIDKQKQNEENLMMSSSKFKVIINSINSNLMIFKKYESDAKSEVATITENNIKNIVEKIKTTIAENNKNPDIDEILSNVQREFDEMIIQLQRSTYDACKNVGDSILSKFPNLFNDLETDVVELRTLIRTYESRVNEEFSRLSKHNNDLKTTLNESLFNNHGDYLDQVINKASNQIENDSNILLQKFMSLLQENNDKQQKFLVDNLRLSAKEIISIEKSQLLPIQSKWESSTCEIINECDFQTNKLLNDHDFKLKEISQSLKETNKFTNTSKTAIDDELTKISKLTSGFQSGKKIEKNLIELNDRFSKVEQQKLNLITGLRESENESLKIRTHLIEKIINNDEISKLEIKNMDKVLKELDTEQKEIKKSLLPTGKTPIRESLKLPKPLDDKSNEVLNRSPPKIQLIGQRFRNDGSKSSVDDEEKENNKSVTKGVNNKRKPSPSINERSSIKMSRINSGGRIPLKKK